MEWIRENKPLAAILGVIIAGSLALGYLLFDALARMHLATLRMGIRQVFGHEFGQKVAPIARRVNENIGRRG